MKKNEDGRPAGPAIRGWIIPYPGLGHLHDEKSAPECAFFQATWMPRELLQSERAQLAFDVLYQQYPVDHDRLGAQGLATDPFTPRCFAVVQP